MEEPEIKFRLLSGTLNHTFLLTVSLPFPYEY